MLDNTVVYWCSDVAEGSDHGYKNMRSILIGSCGGFFKTGRYLDYIDWNGRAYFSQEDGNVIKGVPHNRFLVSVLQAMGLEPADYEIGGNPGYGSTSTAGKDASSWPTDYDLTQVGKVLPGIQG